MRQLRLTALAASAACALALTACGTPDPYSVGEASNTYPPYPVTDGRVTTVIAPPGSTVYGPGPTYVVPGPSGYAVPAVEFGRVTNVALVNPGTRASGNNAAGTIIGGVAGGIIGNQVGGGTGRGVATVLGAITGAAVGSHLSSRPTYNYAGPVYRVWVQTDSGMMRTYDVGTTADLRPGDRVRIENGVIYMG
ncbi:glycine zipper 2TM domain-containing protein [Ramlibacter sp. PS4R-6]|uniref:glycine zipper 2TM domain-containing protein n=1 Tax=Ramlibacter sp. PS4R-6 TaxID=3133438 RepID=UPI00309F34A6